MSVAHLYLRNASRTNKTPAAGIVRVAQREADTERDGTGSLSAVHLETGDTVTSVTQTKPKETHKENKKREKKMGEINTGSEKWIKRT